MPQPGLVTQDWRHRTDVRIRRARPADTDAILALEDHFPGDRMSLRSVRSLVRSRSAIVLVASRGEELLGALVALTRKGTRRTRIYSLAISPAARGQGLAKRLVQHAERAARRLGCLAVSLEVRIDNAAARALYHGLGYTEQGELPDYYDDGAPGLRLARPLRPRR